MCTAVTFNPYHSYFGRNLDLEFNYNECVTITPRNYPFTFRYVNNIGNHFAIIGTAIVEENYPLYFDATNEYGLSMAGLNFPGNAVYLPFCGGKINITPYEFIPWILSQFRTVREVYNVIENINLINTPFNDAFPLSPLHWILADQTESITIEPTANGVKIYNNPIGILTNNPPFDYHMQNICNYMNLTREEPSNRFSNLIGVSPYSRGMGAIGLPGDLSSASRFIKAAFTKLNSVPGENELENVSQFFHILGSVYQQKGCVRVNNGFEKTVYSSCCNTAKGIYYYTTYENSQICAVDIHKENLDSDKIVAYPLIRKQQIRWIN